jgi:tetratricopeptide (TPR) repeat protein
MLAENHNRKVIPRWRDFVTTVALGELSSTSSKEVSPNIELEPLVSQKYQDWRSAKTVWHAADLLSCAVVAGKAASFRDVAEFLVGERPNAPRTLIDLAERILRPNVVPITDIVVGSPQDIHEQIHFLRRRLDDEPRNSIAWTDLSRLYTSVGQWEQAARAMRVAWSLSPTNRFVLRSAGRLFLHLKEPSVALRMLRTEPSVIMRDPWLVAAEIAISSAAQAPSAFAKRGLKLAENDGFSHFARTELRSALGTLSAETGNIRRARQLFRVALHSPNENSLAQVQWADKHVGGIGISQQQLQVPRSFEASGYFNFQRQLWEASLSNALNWMKDQPFSTRPAIFSSYISSSVLERYADSEKILLRALAANPGNPMLLNNLAFARASSGRVLEAAEALQSVNVDQVEGPSVITLLATNGLVLMRSGELSTGRRFYRDALDRATKLGYQRYRSLAMVYLAREEIHARTSEAGTVLREAVEAVGDNPEADVKLILDRVVASYGAEPEHVRKSV